MDRKIAAEPPTTGVVQHGHSPLPAQMLDVDGFAQLLAVSARHVRRLVDAGRCPQPVRLGRLHRWPRKAIDDWIADGCPKCCTAIPRPR
jgi:excisionase family DNA binding protein